MEKAKGNFRCSGWRKVILTSRVLLQQEKLQKLGKFFWKNPLEEVKGGKEKKGNS